MGKKICGGILVSFFVIFEQKLIMRFDCKLDLVLAFEEGPIRSGDFGNMILGQLDSTLSMEV